MKLLCKDTIQNHNFTTCHHILSKCKLRCSTISLTHICTYQRYQ